MINNWFYVAIWKDGYQQSIDDPIPENINKDFGNYGEYVIRKSAYCPDCKTIYQVEYDEPFAHCECGTTEWYL